LGDLSQLDRSFVKNSAKDSGRRAGGKNRLSIHRGRGGARKKRGGKFIGEPQTGSQASGEWNIAREGRRKRKSCFTGKAETSHKSRPKRRRDQSIQAKKENLAEEGKPHTTYSKKGFSLSNIRAGETI